MELDKVTGLDKFDDVDIVVGGDVVVVAAVDPICLHCPRGRIENIYFDG